MITHDLEAEPRTDLGQAASVATALQPAQNASLRSAPRASLGCWIRRIGLAFVLFLFVLAGREVHHYLLGLNLHVVVPGQILRGSSPKPADLDWLVRHHQIRTVLNLRGFASGFDWYDNETAASHELGLDQFDLNLSACRIPPVDEIRRFIRMLDQMERPIFVHCRAGADRTGLVSALLLLLLTDAPLAEGRKQLGMRYGHLPFGEPLYMDIFFGFYEEWLAKRELEHTPARLRHWLHEEYRGAWCQMKVERFVPQQETIHAGKACAFTIRLGNISDGIWNMRTINTAGVHLEYVLVNQAGAMVGGGFGGLVHRDVPPGESVELLVDLVAPREAGRYHVLIDLADRRHAKFSNVSGETYRWEMEVRE